MQEPITKFLKDYWFLILFVGSTVMWLTQQSSLVQQLEHRVLAVETKTAANTDALQDLRESMAKVLSSLEFIKDRIAN